MNFSSNGTVKVHLLQFHEIFQEFSLTLTPYRVMSPPDGVTGDTRYFKRDEIENKVNLFWITHRPYVYHP